MIAAGLIFSVMAPVCASAKNDRGSCRLQSEEFVYVTQSMESKIAYLQADLQRNNVNNKALVVAMNQLIKANEAVYQDAGKYAQTHDQFGYSTARRNMK